MSFIFQTTTFMCRSFQCHACLYELSRYDSLRRHLESGICKQNGTHQGNSCVQKMTSSFLYLYILPSNRNASVTSGTPYWISSHFFLFKEFDILKWHNTQSKMQTCHISDWFVKSYRPFNTATPSCSACTDYGLLDQISLHSVSNSFSP